MTPEHRQSIDDPLEARGRVAANVRRLRGDAGMTQEELAHRAGMATRHLQKVEAAETNLTLATLVRLASAMSVDLSELFAVSPAPLGEDRTTSPSSDIVARISKHLTIGPSDSAKLMEIARVKYRERMQTRFTRLKVSERLKRTNPFLLRIRGVTTVREWAEMQVRTTLIASEEEAVGHLLEAIAFICHPGARAPTYPDDFDYEVHEATDTAEQTVHAYQVKMSWDCMPMSSRKNLSRTVQKLEEVYRQQGISFVGHFAPCYGKAKTTSPPGQRYVSLGSRDFWTMVGDGDGDFDVRVGEVCAILCADFRQELERTSIPALIEELSDVATPLIGSSNGTLDYAKLFRRVNR